MKYAFTLMLCLSLAFYGSTGMAHGAGNAAFSMVICADGVAKTVSFDADGNPVEQTQACHECQTCCQIVGALGPGMWSPSASLSLLDMQVIRPVAHNPLVHKRNLYPAPRGPPVVQLSMQRLIKFDWSADGHILRSDGRPIRKDATA